MNCPCLGWGHFSMLSLQRPWKHTETAPDLVARYQCQYGISPNWSHGQFWVSPQLRFNISVYLLWSRDLLVPTVIPSQVDRRMVQWRGQKLLLNHVSYAGSAVFLSKGTDAKFIERRKASSTLSRLQAERHHEWSWAKNSRMSYICASHNIL